jgi:RNA polymerase sigma-70 factor (ECF subfamily)
MGETRLAPLPEGEDQALRALMVRYQQGEMEAFEDLYRRTLPMIRGYLAATTTDRAWAADLAQESYLQIHRSRRTYDPAYPVKPWMLAIARHVKLRDRRKRWQRLSREVTGFEVLPELPVPAEVEGLADRDAVTRALTRLPESWREALVLHHIYGLHYREVGRLVGVSEGGARIRASRGMASLRAALISTESHD